MTQFFFNKWQRKKGLSIFRDLRGINKMQCVNLVWVLIQTKGHFVMSEETWTSTKFRTPYSRIGHSDYLKLEESEEWQTMEGPPDPLPWNSSWDPRYPSSAQREWASLSLRTGGPRELNGQALRFPLATLSSHPFVLPRSPKTFRSASHPGEKRSHLTASSVLHFLTKAHLSKCVCFSFLNLSFAQP